MSYFSKVKKQGTHQPDYVASGVDSINFNLLANAGIKCVAFDIDGTLTKNKSHTIDHTFAKNLKDKLDTAGIKTRFLASNSIRSLQDIADELGAFEMHQPHGITGKPSKEYYAQLIEKSGCKPHQIVMIGDRLLQDTWGAKRAGLTTILVAQKPEFATLRDKIIGRQWWQPILVRNKAAKQ